MTKNLSLEASPSLLAAIAKQQRKNETVGALFERMLNQRKRSELTERRMLLRSLAQKIAFHENHIQGERSLVAKLQRELDEMKAFED